jgi:acyl-CoA thioester hydrolase
MPLRKQRDEMAEQASNFRFGLRVRYAEVDYQGIVYFAHYATYFDVAIHDFFRARP